MLTLVYFTSFIDFQKKATLSGSLIVIFSFILYIQSKNKENLVNNVKFIKFPINPPNKTMANRYQ